MYNEMPRFENVTNLKKAYFSYWYLFPGKDDEEPEYNDGTWFAMLFACGVGVGLFFYGVAEPVWHYTGTSA